MPDTLGMSEPAPMATSPVKEETPAHPPSMLEPIKRDAASKALATKPPEAAAGVGEPCHTPAAELTETSAADAAAMPVAAPDAGVTAVQTGTPDHVKQTLDARMKAAANAPAGVTGPDAADAGAAATKAVILAIEQVDGVEVGDDGTGGAMPASGSRVVVALRVLQRPGKVPHVQVCLFGHDEHPAAHAPPPLL